MSGDPVQLGCTCGPFWSVVPPGPCPVHVAVAPVFPVTLPKHDVSFALCSKCGWYHATGQCMTPPRTHLSDADVDRIARRVVELLKEGT